ncbi:MAG: IPExxxVDY family protein [Flavobacteriales bacterium]|nr:IPExxxVDY family protein [Flavobacteriales bacterium]
MAKHKLVDEEEDTVPKVSVIGISCHVPDYRLCWALNLALGLGLERRRTDIVEHARGKDLHYPVFQQVGAEGMTTWSLICNLCGKRRLIADQKQADYFLVIDQETAERETDLILRLRSTEFVLLAYPIDINELRNGNKLLL